MPLEMEMPRGHGHNRNPTVAPQVQDVIRATLEPVGSVPRKGHLSCFDSKAEQRLYAHTVHDKYRQREIQMENLTYFSYALDTKFPSTLSQKVSCVEGLVSVGDTVLGSLGNIRL